MLQFLTGCLIGIARQSCLREKQVLVSYLIAPFAPDHRFTTSNARTQNHKLPALALNSSDNPALHIRDRILTHSAQLDSMAGKYAAAHDKTQGPGDARPTALDIVKDEGLEGKLTGKTFLITGASSGGCSP